MVSVFAAVPTALLARLAASKRVPGSAVPLALMMGIFLTKYAVGVTLAMHLVQAGDLAFAMSLSALYGAFSGVFAARAARLWRLALAQDRMQLAAA